MKLTLEIDTYTNEWPEVSEISTILRGLAYRINDLFVLGLCGGGPVYDSNGNHVGRWEVEK